MLTSNYVDRPERVHELAKSAAVLRGLVHMADNTVDEETKRIGYKVALGLEKRREEEIAWQTHNAS